MSEQYPPPPASGSTLSATSGATLAPTTGATPAPTMGATPATTTGATLATTTGATPATGATPGPQTLTSVAPPDYGDIYKQQQQPPSQQPAQGFPIQPQGFAGQPQGFAVQPQGFAVQPQGFAGQPQGFPIQPQFAYMHQPDMQPAIQPMQYMMPAPMQMVAVNPRPNYPGPHDFLILALIVTIVCAFLNLTSLVFGITAIILAATSKSQKGSANYPSAKKYATAALALTICTIVYTLVFAIFSIGISFGLFNRYLCTYLRHNSYSGYYCSAYPSYNNYVY